MKKLITEQNNHIFICGMTRSGKTYFAIRALEQVKQGVLFINIQNAETTPKYNIAYADKIKLSQLVSGLRAGEKIDLRFPNHWDMEKIMEVIKYLGQHLLKQGFDEKNYIYFAIDECQILNADAIKAIRLTCTRGLYLGVRCVFITQRPALADLTFYTQASEHYIFQLGNGEREYFKNKGLNYDDMKVMWDNNGTHSYIYSDGFILEGRKPI